MNNPTDIIDISKLSKRFLSVRPGVGLAENVYLVYPDIDSFHGLPYHSGIASLAAVLKEQGYKVKVKCVTSESQYDEVVREVLEFQPAVVGFTTVETQFGHVQEMAALVKVKHPCITVVGGTHLTLWPQALLEKDSVGLDCGMRGECEHPFAELVRNVQKGEDYHSVDNVCYRDPKTEELVQNPLRPLDPDLTNMPQPATEVFDYQGIIHRDHMAVFHFNRGCPYPCTYCSAQQLAREYGSVKDGLRQRPVDNALEQIKLTLEKYDVPSDTLLLFSDDLFTLHKDWLYEFLSRYESEIGRPFWSTARSNLASHEQFDRLKSAGASTIMMAIESGNDYIRNTVMKRNISRRVMFQSFELAEKFKLKTCSPCVIGVPGETPEHVEDSLNTVAQFNITHKAANVFFPYQGTPLRKVCDDNGYLPEKYKVRVKERKESILDLPTISKAQIKYYHDNWENLLFERASGGYPVGKRVKNLMLKAMDNTVGEKVKGFVDSYEPLRKLRTRVSETLVP
jgi:anaerobic magnesium-protoporphyrin IX monomethyl ester cyclase